MGSLPGSCSDFLGGIVNAVQARSLAGRLYRRAPFRERQRARLRASICPFDRVIEAVPHGASVLDAGCGNGLLAGLLIVSGRAASVVGFDSSKALIAIAQRMVERAGLARRAAFFHQGVDDDWPAGPFDAVTLIDVMHHLRPATRISALRQAYASLRPGGVLVYKDMAARPVWAAAANQIHDLLFSRQLVRPVDSGQLAEAAREAGFSKAAESTVRILWYCHELLLFVR